VTDSSKPLEISRFIGKAASVRRAANAIVGALSTLFLVAALVAIWGVGSAQAEDTRPKSIPYETKDGVPTLDPSYRHSDHKVVIITDSDLNPRLMTIEEGQLIAWISYARSPSTIVFEREVAKSMICHSLINFSIEDDELKSAEIHPGEFASFCQLKPGRYTYKVVRRDPKLAGASGGHKRIDGEIIVGNP
jgi:hypothetical protein